MSEETTRKNFKAVQQFMAETRKADDDLINRIKYVEGVLAMQQTEIQALRQQVILLLTKQGGGPTSGSYS